MNEMSEAYPNQKLRQLMCDVCRSGLEKNRIKCSHLKIDMIISLAQELTQHEMAHPGSRPSELYQLVDAYVDDPEFWFHVTQMKEKLHLHVKPYMRQTFIEKARCQLNRLSGQRYGLKSIIPSTHTVETDLTSNWNCLE